MIHSRWINESYEIACVKQNARYDLRCHLIAPEHDFEAAPCMSFLFFFFRFGAIQGVCLRLLFQHFFIAIVDALNRRRDGRSRV